MGVRRLVLLTALWLGAGRPAWADGVCVTVDVQRDNLTEAERSAVRIALMDALEQEGVAVDRTGGRCQGVVSVYSIRLDRAVATTLVVGDRRVDGRASSIDEVDLLIRQLTRSLVTGRSLATGFGVTDRTNVLRDQTAPRRVDAADSRRWDPVLAVGGGMLQLPPGNGRARQRQYDIVSIEARTWGFLTSERSAFELYGRILLHDYAVIGNANDAFEDAREQDDSRAELRRLFGLLGSPFAVANWDVGFGMVSLLGSGPPRPFVRLGATMSALCRFSDPDFRFDLGFGGYVGLGMQLSSTVHLSVAANVSNPVVHDFTESGYWYFLTTTAMLEFRGKGKVRPAPRLFQPDPEPTQTIRRINE